MNKLEYNIAVNDYSERLFRYAFKWLKNEQDSKDLVQDVYGKLWELRDNVSSEKCRPWLFTCMHNALVNFTKKKNIMDSFEDVNMKSHSSYQPNLALQDLLEKSLAQLSDIQRSIILLRDLEGYAYDEIGEILGLNEAQVKVYLFRARLKVKEQLKDLSVLVA